MEHRKLIEQHASSTNPETESLRKHQFHELRELFQVDLERHLFKQLDVLLLKYIINRIDFGQR